MYTLESHPKCSQKPITSCFTPSISLFEEVATSSMVREATFSVVGLENWGKKGERRGEGKGESHGGGQYQKYDKKS